MGISLNDHERRIKNIEGQLPDIQNRINNIIANAKQWEIVTSRTSGWNRTFTFDHKFDSWNYAVLSYNVGFSNRNFSSLVNGMAGYWAGNYFEETFGRNFDVRWSRSGNVINIPQANYDSSITVIFYK